MGVKTKQGVKKMTVSRTVSIDTCQIIAMSCDQEFATIFGMDIPGGWTKFVDDVLIHRGTEKISGSYDDLFNDIINGILTSCKNGGGLQQKIELVRSLSQNQDELVNKLRPVLTAAIDYRLRDFRRKDEYKFGQEQYPANFETSYCEVPGSEMDADDLKSMIENELDSDGSSCAQLAKKIFPDRVAGFSLREICDRHGLSRGQAVSNALNLIYAAVKTVAEKLEEPWILRFISKL